MWGTATTASASAIRPTGMLIQKTQRQPQASVMRPPASGPTRIAIGNAAPMIDRTRGRSRGGASTSPTIVCGIRCRPAEPMPCATRAIASCVMSCARPQSSDATGRGSRLGQEDQARTDEVGELAEHRQQHRAGQRVRDDDPAHLLDGAEVAGDRRERRRDDRVIERTEERHGEQGDDEETESPGSEWHSRSTRTIGPSTRRGVPRALHHGRERIRRDPDVMSILAVLWLQSNISVGAPATLRRARAAAASGVQPAARALRTAAPTRAVSSPMPSTTMRTSSPSTSGGGVSTPARPQSSPRQSAVADGSGAEHVAGHDPRVP